MMELVKKYKNIIIILIVALIIITIFLSKKYIINKDKNKNDNLKEFSTMGDVKEQVSEYKLYEFVSSNCPACESMKESYEKVKNEYEDKMNFEVVNTLYNMQFSRKYKVNVVPTFIILDKEGNIIKRSIGAIGYDNLKNMVEGVLKK